MSQRGNRDFAIGSNVWPGLGKCIEEAGEFTTVAGKLIATAGQIDYWDGKPLDERLIEEIGDLQAALSFFIVENMSLQQMAMITDRVQRKLALFRQWQANGDPPPPMKGIRE